MKTIIQVFMHAEQSWIMKITNLKVWTKEELVPLFEESGWSVLENRGKLFEEATDDLSQSGMMDVNNFVNSHYVTPNSNMNEPSGCIFIDGKLTNAIIKTKTMYYRVLQAVCIRMKQFHLKLEIKNITI